MHDLVVCIFSYNRGRYLENCIQSVQRHLSDASLRIYDDGSTQAEAQRVLDEYEDRIFISRGHDVEQGWRGGLYANMAQAFKQARRDGFRFVLCMQDDMQVVRPLTADDLRRVGAYFSDENDTLQLSVSFERRKQPRGYTLSAHGPYFFAKEKRFASFSDVGIFDLHRLEQVQWSFEESEEQNDVRLREMGYTLGFYAYPFTMWLPSPQGYAKDNSSFLKNKLRILLGWWYGRGFYPYRGMKEREINA